MAYTNVLVYKNGMVMWVPPMTNKAMCKMNLKNYPYDEHTCIIKIGSWTHDGFVMGVKSQNDSKKKCDG